jgi:uncharacterized protein
MKLLLLVIAVVVLVWLVRSSLRRVQAPPSSAGRPAPQAMLACAHCGVHVPASEALPGRGGVFCGPAHRAAFEQAHPE